MGWCTFLRMLYIESTGGIRSVLSSCFIVLATCVRLIPRFLVTDGMDLEQAGVNRTGQAEPVACPRLCVGNVILWFVTRTIGLRIQMFCLASSSASCLEKPPSYCRIAARSSKRSSVSGAILNVLWLSPSTFGVVGGVGIGATPPGVRRFVPRQTIAKTLSSDHQVAWNMIGQLQWTCAQPCTTLAHPLWSAQVAMVTN